MDALPRNRTAPAATGSLTDLLSLWVEQTSDYGIAFLALDGKVVGVTPGVEKVFGYRPDELIGDTLRILFTPEDRERGLDRYELELASQTGRSEDDRWHLGKDGRRVWVSGVLTALQGPAGERIGFAKIMRDRTDVRTQIEALENRLSEAAGATTRHREALATIGHELRNPLNTIGNAFTVLRQGGAPAAGLFEVIGRQMATLQRLLDDLRDSARSSSAEPKLEPAEVNVQAAIQAAVGLHEPAARARGQVLRALLPAQPIVMQADPIRLEQILRNLLDNAIKYTPRHGNISVSATVEEQTVVVRVVDDGIGISAEVMPRVFELFTRERRDSAEPAEGLGVGLAVVQHLVRRHDGIVEVQSAGAGRGSEFTVRLPLHRS